MAEITAELVRTLRDKTNAGMMECKGALKEAEGDLEKAEVILRKKGTIKAEKKADRQAKEGIIHSYSHLPGRIVARGHRRSPWAIPLSIDGCCHGLGEVGAASRNRRGRRGDP